MKQKKNVVGFIGAGGIARAHVFSLNSLPYYYEDSPEIKMESVCSATASHRKVFAERYGFSRAQTLEEFLNNKSIDTVFILGPNKVHYEHLKAALSMPDVKRIYLEKPVCSTAEEEAAIVKLMKEYPETVIQVGFQYLFSTQIRASLAFWKTGRIGRPIHFDIKYYHGDYLRKDYRARRISRLTPAPDGGAMADLGSHAVSLLIAFLGDKMQIMNALQAGHFDDVPDSSDLFSLINLFEPLTRAAGTLSASRVSSGTGDLISFELFAEKGSVQFSTHTPDYFEYYLEETAEWSRNVTGSDYGPVTSFPSSHVPPGWLRSMVHAHYIFLTGSNKEPFIPDITHGLAVQRIVRETADHLSIFRKDVLE